MSSLREKLEKVHSLLINEENEQAELLFHEAFVEAAREIHKGIMEEEDWLEEDADETVEEDSDEEVDESVEADPEAEQQDESFYAEVTPLGEVEDDEEMGAGEEVLGGDEELPMDPMDDAGEEVAGDDLEDELVGDEEGDVEERISDLEAELDALKAEFEELQDIEDVEHGDDYNHEDEVDDNDGDEGDADDAEESEESEEGEEVEESADTSIYEEVDALDEAFELEDVSNTNTEDGIGSGQTFDPSVNKDSPMPQKKGSARQGGKAVNVNAKGSNHKGFDRETPPGTKPTGVGKNVRGTAKEDTSKMGKEGDSSAAINKTESEFGKGNEASPIGSKGTTQTKGLTESRKRKA